MLVICVVSYFLFTANYCIYIYIYIYVYVYRKHFLYNFISFSVLFHFPTVHIILTRLQLFDQKLSKDCIQFEILLQFKIAVLNVNIF